MSLPEVFVEIVALHMHILGASGRRRGYSRDVCHFGGNETVFVGVSLVRYQIVKAELFKFE